MAPSMLQPPSPVGHGRSAVLLATLASSAAELPPGLVRSFRADFPAGWEPVHHTWLLDLQPSAGQYRVIMRLPSYFWGEPFREDILYKNVSAQGHPNVTYGPDRPATDRVCARSQEPIAPDFPNPFVAAFLRTGANWTSAGNSTEGDCRWWRTEELGTEICVAADGAPVRLVDALAGKIELSRVQLGPLPAAAFAQAEACDAYPVPPCPNESIVDLTVYRVHASAEPMELDNRDVADLLGLSSVACNWVASNDTLVTAWALTAAASWGQYGRCHYQDGRNTCDAQTGNYVGRQAPQGMTVLPLQGQCSGNRARGSWYSLPAGGRCRPGDAVGTGGCTWSARPVRTIQGECAAGGARFKAACDAAQVAPGGYDAHRPASFFERAFASEHRILGGCPNATPGSELASLVV